ncbi:FtsX-like permease family protein [Bacillus lacus]|uniref:FtsX-like permease family protein n=1 Tax=Metabacillus lacus TaxID=1983721 RepID=A0A7X2IYY6_9BACI|nr:ABC transporter permease [Metabacillus lacus]MRX72072.1 FtsX-like permease family protein [Metabacillus lacus]
MIPVYLKKAFLDARKEQKHFLLIMLTILISISTAGFLLNTKYLFENSVEESRLQNNNADFTFYTEPFQQLPGLPEQIAGLSAYEPKFQTQARIRTEKGFQNADITALPENGKFEIDKIHWKPAIPSAKGIFIEESSFRELRQPKELEISLPGGITHYLPVLGQVKDTSRIPARFTGTVYLYMTQGALEDLGLSETYNRVAVTFEENQASPEQVVKALEEQGIQVFRFAGSEELSFIRERLAGTVLTLLISLCLTAVFLCFLLTVQMFYRLIENQRLDIGIQRAIGSSRLQILSQYAALLTVMGALLFLAAAVISYYGSQFSAAVLAENLNLLKPDEHYSLQILLLIGLLSFLFPLCSACFPLSSMLRQPVLLLLGSGQGAAAPLKKKKARSSFSFRLSTLAARNAARKKLQYLFTITLLSFGGAVIIASFSLHHSLSSVLKNMENAFHYEAEWGIRSEAGSSSAAERALAAVTGVDSTESWTVRNTKVSETPDNGTNVNALFHAVPAESTFFRPNIIEGNWISGSTGIVINSDLKNKLTGLQTGDEVTLTIGQRTASWEIAGIAESHLKGPAVFLSKSEYESWLGISPENRLLVKADERKDVENIMIDGERALLSEGITVEHSDAVIEMTGRLGAVISYLLYGIMAAGCLFSLLGISNLMMAFSANVYDRRKEIAILQSLGAPHSKIYMLFTLEAFLISASSWLAASAVSVPMFLYLARKLGESLFQSPLPPLFSPYGYKIWLLISILICVAASFKPVSSIFRQALRKHL